MANEHPMVRRVKVVGKTPPEETVYPIAQSEQALAAGSAQAVGKTPREETLYLVTQPE